MKKKLTKDNKVSRNAGSSKTPKGKAAQKKLIGSLFTRLTPTKLWILAGVIVFAGIGARLTLFSSATTFEYLGKHPQAALQPENSAGRIIRTLKAWNGKIYAGYGDWNVNSGPIALTPYDPASKAFASTPEFHADTETIDLFREIGGRLFAPSIDPRYNADYTVGTIQPSTTGASTVQWSGVTPVGMVHDFDMVSLNGPNDLWLAGSKDFGTGYDHAVVYHSADGGTTWQLSLDQSGSTGKHARFYMIGAYGGKLYTQGIEFGNDYIANRMPNSKVFDGSRWSDGPSLANSGFFYHAEEYAGKMIFQTHNQGGNLIAFDGRNSTAIKGNVRNYTIAPDGYLYLLSYDGTISKTQDLNVWQNVTLAPAGSVAIEVLDNYIYVGTQSSDMYRANVAVITNDKIAPIVSVTSPVAGSTVSGTVPLTVIATDDGGISKVEIYIDNRLYYTPNSAPYTINWDTVGQANGTHTLKAVAYDASFNATSSETISFTVYNAVSADATPPSVYSISPSEGTKLKGSSVTLKGSAGDNVGVVRLEFLVDDDMIASNTNSTSLEVKKWSTRNLLRGPHTFTLNAYDAAGNKTSKTVNVTK